MYPDVNHVLNILRKKYASRQFRKVFRDWDVDKDGCITMGELDSNLRRQGVCLAPHQVKEIFENYDSDRDGRMEYSDFVQLIVGPVQELHSNPSVQTKIKKQREVTGAPPDSFMLLRNATLEKVAAGDVRERSVLQCGRSVLTTQTAVWCSVLHDNRVTGFEQR